MLHLGHIVSHSATYRPHHEGVIFGEHRLTWREFDARVRELADALLHLGLRKGDRLALVLPNSLELIELYWAAARTGLVLVPLSPLLRGSGLLTLLRDSGALAVISTHASVEVLEEVRPSLPDILPDRWILTDAEETHHWQHLGSLRDAEEGTSPVAPLDRDDPFNIIYSSGTTGLPKGIVHTHLIRANYATTFAAAFRMTPESVVLHSGALIFNGALVFFFPAFWLGARFILQKKFEAQEYLAAIQREQVTHLMLVPSQIAALLDAPGCTAEALKSVQALCSVGAPLPVEHKARLQALCPNALYELYGLTEGFVTVLDRNHYASRMGSVGTPTYFNEMRIVGEDGRDVPTGEVGEIVGRGPLLMPGYHGRPDLTAEAIRDGWLFTGDLGRVDEDGFLYLVDRKKDLIISGGVNVYPKDVEEVLATHPDVRESAVFGIPHPRWGEVPIAAVIPREGSALDTEALRQWVNSRVAARWQKLESIVLMDDFPRSAAGKTLKRVMREPYWEGRTTKI